MKKTKTLKQKTLNTLKRTFFRGGVASARILSKIK